MQLASRRLPIPLRSEVDDDIARGDDRIIPGRRNSRVGVAVERRGVERAIVGDFGTHLDLRRQPVLPAQRDVEIARGSPGPLSLHVVVPFGAN